MTHVCFTIVPIVLPFSPDYAFLFSLDVNNFRCCMNALQCELEMFFSFSQKGKMNLSTFDFYEYQFFFLAFVEITHNLFDSRKCLRN